MIYFAMFLLGGLLGIALWFYLSGFITRLQQEIYATYVELFPQNRSPFQPHFAYIQPKKCGHILRYFLGIGVGFIFLQIAFKDSIFTVWFGLTLLILGQSAILIGTINLFLLLPVYGYLQSVYLEQTITFHCLRYLKA